MVDSNDNQIIVPFLKWAGGKRWLVSSNSRFFPNSYNRYIEPFLGSGAVFFYLNPRQAVLSDLNSELIETYQAIKEDWARIVGALSQHQRKHSEKYYYKVRAQCPRTIWGRAARFIYLNRTCWNGLYRVNLNGEFNVPIGTKDRVILDSDDFRAVSVALKHTHLVCSDFEAIIDKAKKGDFVFVDPPYTVKHNFNGFVKYNEKLFSWDDQIRLSEATIRAAARGAKILLTNADHPHVFNLYKKYFSTTTVSRRSILAGKSEARVETTELIVSNYL